MLTALLLSALLGQTEPAPSAEPTPPPPPPALEPTVPPAFYEGVLSWDSEGKQVVKGRERTPLVGADFFREVGRVDLIEKADGLRRRRLILAVSAGAVLVAGSISSITFFANAGDLNSSYCTANVRNYNDVCMPHYKGYSTAGGATLAATLITTGLLATLAWWSEPELEADEATHLVAQHNASLLKRLRARPGSLRWLPAVINDGAMLAVGGRF